jgi:hypothetical protein
MIPQPFGNYGSSGYSLSKFQYVPGADIIFDFANPATTGSVALGLGYASNVIPNGVQMTLQSQYAGGKPTLGGAAGGSLTFLISTLPYVTWNYHMTAAQTTLWFYKPSGNATLTSYPAQGNEFTVNPQDALKISAGWVTGSFKASSTIFDNTGAAFNMFTNTVMDTNSYSGWIMAALTTNGTNQHAFWQNNATGSFNTTSMTRATTANQTVTFGLQYPNNAGISGELVAFMQYPRQLNQREIKQTFQLFKQRI